MANVKLRVAEALPKDVGRALARFDPADIAKLDLKPGDIVTVTGRRATVGKAMPAFREFRGHGRIHIDGITRENAGAGLDDIVEGSACAPLPVPGADALQAMGRTNDAILYGGQVHLTVKGDAAAAQALAANLPSLNSPDHGRSFAELFEAAGQDFYKLDGALFAPAQVWLSHLGSGRTWHAGRLDMNLLLSLWQAA